MRLIVIGGGAADLGEAVDRVLPGDFRHRLPVRFCGFGTCRQALAAVTPD